MQKNTIRNRQIAEEAAEWALQLEEGELTPEQSHELSDWLLESPLHADELLINSAILSGLEEIDTFGSDSVDDLLSAKAPEAIALFPEQSVRSHDTDGVAQDRREQVEEYISAEGSDLLGRPVRVAVAAMLALIMVGVTSLILWQVQAEQQAEMLAFASKPGQQRMLALEDGSMVSLSRDTQVRVGYGEDARIIFLDRGEAVFNVAHDPDRPFRVFAGDTLAEALGTTFTVQLEGDNASVSVLEGKVGVTQIQGRNTSEELLEAAAGIPAMVLRAGERSELSARTGRIVRVSEPSIERLATRQGEKLATPGDASSNSAVTRDGTEHHSSRSGYIEFTDETLSSIAQRFNRQNGTKIRIVDQSLGSKRFSGVFEADDPQSFVDFLTLSQTARVTRTGQELRLSEPGM